MIVYLENLTQFPFSLKQFADFYTKRDFSKCQAYIKKLWGDNFMDAQGKWSKKPKEGSVRGFNKLVLDPIYKVCPGHYYDY